MVDMAIGTTILIRRLPRNTTRDGLRGILLFAKDLQEVDFLTTDHDADHGYLTAMARFHSTAGASEAQNMLDGKPNTTGDTLMIVEIVGMSPNMSNARRNSELNSSRSMPNSMSPPSSNSQLSRQASRFNGAFQTLDRISPPTSGTDHASPEAMSHMQAAFSPHSPVDVRTRVTGKSVIDQDAVDEDTGELLKDPLAYMKNDQGSARRSTNPQLPNAAFNKLSLNTNMVSSTANYGSPITAINLNAAFSPKKGAGSGYHAGNGQTHRHNYPPVNPADQNPPCNTLYVGNLPIDTSEDELKAMFSKQRGYKRLCFRTKQNGPMCFVEFEDVSFATKALNELYGVQLHNSVKGGIRLSFSKNPLGVRAGQAGSGNPSTPLSPQGHISGMGSFGPMSPGGFGMANGPPPGLSMPPGLNSPVHATSPGMNTPLTAIPSMAYNNTGLGHQNYRGPQIHGNMPNGPMSGPYPDYMMGR